MKKLLVKILAKLIELRTRWRANFWHYRSAVRRAERLAAGSGSRKGRRTYVYFIGGRYRVLNRKDIRNLRNTCVFRRDMNVTAMKKICLYDTMTKVNSHPQFKNAKL